MVVGVSRNNIKIKLEFFFSKIQIFVVIALMKLDGIAMGFEETTALMLKARSHCIVKRPSFSGFLWQQCIGPRLVGSGVCC